MRLERRHHVGESIAVDVVDGHLGAPLGGASGPSSERLRMVRPESLLAAWWLLPPAVRVDDIHPAIAVDVAHADPVGARRSGFAHNRREPGSGRIGWIGLRIAQRASRAYVHQLG